MVSSYFLRKTNSKKGPFTGTRVKRTALRRPRGASTGCASIFDDISSYCTYGNTKFSIYSCESIVFTAVLKFKYYSR